MHVLRVMHLITLVCYKEGTLQCRCQNSRWLPIIAAKKCSCYIINYFERNCMAISLTKPTVFTFGLVFMANDNVDTESW